MTNRNCKRKRKRRAYNPNFKKRSEFVNIKEICALLEKLKENGYTFEEALELLKCIAEKRYR